MTISIGATITSGASTHTCDANTKALVIVVNSIDSTSGDLPITSITYNSVSLTKAKEYIGTGGYGASSIWYLKNPPTGTSYSIVVTYTGSVTAGSLTAINLVSTTCTYIAPQSGKNYGGETTSGTHTITLTSVQTGSMLISGAMFENGTPGNISVSTGTQLSEVDLGSWVSTVASGTESSGTVTTTWSKLTTVNTYAAAVSFMEINDSTSASTSVSSSPSISPSVSISSSPSISVSVSPSISPSPALTSLTYYRVRYS